MECPENTCISQHYDANICEDITSDMKVFNGICFNDYHSIQSKFSEMAENSIKLNYKEGVTLSVYSYRDYSNNFDKILEKNSKSTIIDIRECLSLYKKQNNIDEETDIYIVVADTPSMYSNETINRFDFELYLDDMTRINNLDICKDLKMNIYSPLSNSNLLNLKLGNYFNEFGYNIFNKDDKFYKDVCSGANMDGNDITLNDRYIDIYPHDVQTCPKDCECLGLNYTTNVFKCNCDIKLNNDDKSNYEYDLTNTDDIINYFKDFNNLVEFFSDMINYKIIKCYELLYNLNNYIHNTGFYLGAVFFVTSTILLVLFRVKGFYYMRYHFNSNLKNLIFEKNKILSNQQEKQKENDLKHKKNLNRNKSKKKSTKSVRNQFKSKEINNKNSRKYKSTKIVNEYNKDNFNTDKPLNNENSKDGAHEEELVIQNISNERKITKNVDNVDTVQVTEKEDNNEKDNKEMNELSYFEAKDLDKRNFFVILFSILFMKIDLIKNIIYPDDYSSRFLLFNIYLLSSYLDLLMNCLLYNDYAISQKYHCNGQLEFITSFIMSTLSNIFTFMITYVIEYLTNFSSIVEIIIEEIKNIKDYLTIIVRLYKIMRIKFICLFIIEIILGLFMVYYITIFSIVNSKSINSFLLNYLYSQLESLLMAFAISLLVTILRKISLSCKAKRLYLASLYFNEHL
jgi:hypothetical protein